MGSAIKPTRLNGVAGSQGAMHKGKKGSKHNMDQRGLVGYTPGARLMKRLNISGCGLDA